MPPNRRQTVAALLAASLPLPTWSHDVSGAPATYQAIAMQLTARSIQAAPDRASGRAGVLRHIDDIFPKIAGAKAFIEQYGGAPVRLVVLPEYLFQSFPIDISIADYAKLAAFAPDGPEYEAIGALAQKLGVFLSGNTYESDENFPGLYFQASFVAAPSGDIVLRYRRLNSMFAPTPHDVWEKYLDIYGIDGVFPVADTDIGRLTCIASEEIIYPEIARALALRGAEIFLHSSSEVGTPLDSNKDVAKRARAFENLAYVVSANTAGIEGVSLPLASADGNSQIVDYRGNVVAQSNSGETFTAFADIDLGALRKKRRTPAMTNYLARQRLELFAPIYAATSPQPANSLIGVTPDRGHFKRVQEQTIDRMMKEGLI